MIAESISPSDSELDADELVALARSDLRHNRQDLALIKLKVAVRHPSCPAAGIALLGQTYADLGLFSHAQQWLSRYIELHPKSPTELFQLGLTYLELGDRSQAKAIWSSVLKLMPDHPPSLYFTAVASNLDGNKEDARRDLMQLLHSTSPDNKYVLQGKNLLNELDTNFDEIKPETTTPYTNLPVGNGVFTQ